MEQVDVVIIGAGAAGMMAAIEAGRRGRRVLVLDHNKTPGEKIRISGGGRCNFTNLNCTPDAFLSQNPKFAISALSRFSQWDIIDRITGHNIAWHEKTLGQLFCDGSARQVVDMLVADMAEAGVEVRLGTKVGAIGKSDDGFQLHTDSGAITASSLVVATGGKSIPKMGASGFGYQIANQFGLALEEMRPGLVPLTFSEQQLATLKPLAGLAVQAAVSCGAARFQEGLLFTHRGLSGPSVLQISSYWRDGQQISVDLLPGQDAQGFLESARQLGARHPSSVLATILPKRLAALIAGVVPAGKNMADLSALDILDLAAALNQWTLKPTGTEGYRTAEVTLGGVSTRELNSKTMEARKIPGLFFIGEVVDVTCWLGGYNFQWAWSSGWSAGQVA